MICHSEDVFLPRESTIEKITREDVVDTLAKSTCHVEDNPDKCQSEDVLISVGVDDSVQCCVDKYRVH